MRKCYLICTVLLLIALAAVLLARPRREFPGVEGALSCLSSTAIPASPLAPWAAITEGAVNPPVEAPKEWAEMVRLVESAKQGPGIIAPSGQYGAIVIEYTESPSGGRVQSLWYVAGMLGPEDGSMSLNVGPKFGDGIETMIRISEKREAIENARPQNSDNWPVTTRQAEVMAQTFAEVARGPANEGMCLNPDYRKQGPIRRYTITVGSRVRLVMDGTNGAILEAKNLAPPPTGTPLHREAALAFGKKIAKAMGVTGEPRVVSRGQTWLVTWKGKGSECAEVRLNAQTGAFLSAVESFKDVHPRVPTKAEVAYPEGGPGRGRAN